MQLSLGEKIFLDMTRFGTDAIVLWTDPTKELHIAALTAKLLEDPAKSLGFNNHRGDLDAYILLGTYMLDKDNTIGLNYTLVHSDGNLPPFAGDDPEDLFIPNCDSVNFQNVGVHANGKISGFSYAAEADFQFGKVKNLYDLEEDLKFSGWAVIAKLGYMIDPVNLRASFAMGSGDKDTDDHKIQEFQALVGSDNISGITRLAHYTMVYERLIRTSAAEQIVTTSTNVDDITGIPGNSRTTGIANTTYYNIGVDVNPMKDLSMSVDGFLIRATKNQIWEDATGESISKDMGWEVDFKAAYKLAKSLTYFVEAGYFNAGNFYEDVYGYDYDIKNASTVVHGLKLEF
jgi:hypothetical protein